MPVKPEKVKAARDFFARDIPRFAKALAQRHPELFVRLHEEVERRSATIKQLKTIGAYFVSLPPEQQEGFYNLLQRAYNYSTALGVNGSVQVLLANVEKKRKGEELTPCDEYHVAYIAPTHRLLLERYLPPKLLAELKEAHFKGKFDKSEQGGGMLPHTLGEGDWPHTLLGKVAMDLGEKETPKRFQDAIKAAMHAAAARASELKTATKKVLFLKRVTNTISRKARYFMYELEEDHYQGIKAVEKAQKARLGKKHISPQELSKFLYEHAGTILEWHPFSRDYPFTVGQWRTEKEAKEFETKLLEKLDPMHFETSVWSNGEMYITPHSKEAQEFLKRATKKPQLRARVSIWKKWAGEWLRRRRS